MRADGRGRDAGLLTRVEAAEYLGVSKQTLAIWLSTGRYDLPVVKVGRLAKYRRTDLDVFLRNRTTANGQKPRSGPKSKSPDMRDRKESGWRNVMLRWKQSGLSAREFCRQESIKESRFYSWRKELRIRDHRIVVEPEPTMTDNGNPFVPLRIVQEQQLAEICQGIEIVLAGGARIKVTNNTPMDLLAKVLKVMEPEC